MLLSFCLRVEVGSGQTDRQRTLFGPEELLAGQPNGGGLFFFFLPRPVSSIGHEIDVKSRT